MESASYASTTYWMIGINVTFGSRFSPVEDGQSPWNAQGNFWIIVVFYTGVILLWLHLISILKLLNSKSDR